MWNFFIDNRRFSFLLIVALIGFGLFSVKSIPKESAPEVQIPVGIVTTLLPGAPAVDVESLVTNEIERGLSGSLENVKRITSTSRESVSTIVVEFAANANVDDSVRKLRDRVETLLNRLPSDAERPTVSEVNFVDQPILTLAIAGPRTDSEFSIIAKELTTELEGIPGVSRVETSGVRDREVTVLLDETKINRFGLTINEVLQGLRSANSLFPVGSIVTDGVSYNITLEGDIDRPELVPKVPIAVRGDQPITLDDIANVDVGLSPIVTQTRLSTNNELTEQAFTVSVYKLRGGDITVLADTVLAKISSLQGTGLLRDLTIYPIQNAGELIKKDLIQLSQSGVVTIILVVSLLVLTIGWREGLLAGLAIPLSFTIGFIGLYISGNTINFISLFSLILGIGVLVDSGIVIVESIHRRIMSGLDRKSAAKETIKEFAAPLTSGTLTTVAMFVGLFVVSGVTGQFIASIPYTLIFVLFASLLVALGFLPIIAAAFLKSHQSNKLEALQEGFSHKLELFYKKWLSYILSNRKIQSRFLLSIVAGFILAIALVPLGLVKVVFFEQSDVDELFVEIKLPEGTVRDSTDLAVRQIEETLYEYSEMIKAFSVTVGAGSVFGSEPGANTRLANIYIALKEDRPLTSLEFGSLLREKLTVNSNFAVSIAQPDAGPPTGSPIGVKLFGDDLEQLSRSALAVKDYLLTLEGVTNVETSSGDNHTEFVFGIDQEKAMAAGVSAQAISQLLRVAVFGSEATSITTLSDDIPIMVRLNLSRDGSVDPEYANWTNVERLLDLEILTNKGTFIPLGSVLIPSLREASNVIRHENQERVMTVSSDITAAGNVREINAQISDWLNKNDVLAPGVSYSLGGEAEESNQAFAEMFLALVIGVVLMIGILVLQFDSYRHTAYVLSILPFSLIGILFGLALTGSALSFPSILGFIALSGIIVNNSILLIDQMNRLRKEDPYSEIMNTVIKASVSRLRPILLTSSTTIVGMVPLLFTDEIWIPLAAAIIFGLAFSVIITLILVPIIYCRWPGRSPD